MRAIYFGITEATSRIEIQVHIATPYLLEQTLVMKDQNTGVEIRLDISLEELQAMVTEILLQEAR